MTHTSVIDRVCARHDRDVVQASTDRSFVRGRLRTGRDRGGEAKNHRSHRPDGDVDWLTNRPAPKGFYGLPKFMRTVDAKILGRKTFDLSVKMGANFSANDVHYVFSRQPPPPSVPVGVRFVTQPITAFAKQMRAEAGKNIWMMGGGELIGSFLDDGAIDEFIVSVIPMFIGEGIPLIARRHRQVPLRLLSVQRFSDGVVQLHYHVRQTAG
ncbi:MAG: dihydrofolate reductase [Acidobacteria bacterium]|nr:MAG: dihydrofolate reductase [Acidobacteriota bacterium]